MLKPAEKTKLNKKLHKLMRVQAVDREAYIVRRHLDKVGDAKWEKYVRKCLAIYDKYLDREYRQFRVTYTRALHDLRKGKKSPHINI